MPAPDDSIKTGGRLSGDNVRQYLEDFAERFLKGKIRFDTEVLNICRRDHGRRWKVLVHERRTGGAEKVLYFSRLIVCTGVSFVHRYCRVDLIPHLLSHGFLGLQ
jgi:dimethylaniline monooxygenase (N-oxide forming)